MALNQNFEDVVTVPVRVSSAMTPIVSGQIVFTNNLIGVAMFAGTTGDTISVAIKGGFTYSAVLGAAVGVGDPAYWDVSNGRIADKAASTMGSDPLLGIFAKTYAAASYNYMIGVPGSTGQKSAGVDFYLMPSGYSPISTYNVG